MLFIHKYLKEIFIFCFCFLNTCVLRNSSHLLLSCVQIPWSWTLKYVEQSLKSLFDLKNTTTQQTQKTIANNWLYLTPFTLKITNRFPILCLLIYWLFWWIEIMKIIICVVKYCWSWTTFRYWWIFEVLDCKATQSGINWKLNYSKSWFNRETTKHSFHNFPLSFCDI